MKIIPVESGPVATYGYLLIDSKSQKAIMIDVPMDCTDAVISVLEQNSAELETILLTHTHWDHMVDCAALQKDTGAEVYVHPDDNYRLSDPLSHSIVKLPFPIEPVVPQKYLEHGDAIACGSIIMEVRHTPGHSEGGCCFIEATNNVVFSGDTLFAGSIGRTDLPGGDLDLLLNSINDQLMTLPDTMKVFCGHGPVTTIAEERANNPFLIQKNC
ncbi:MAG: MBL fold metallo-hydrolase [Candidatus Kapabacteria bacterium]|jgi:hydroxyacylglutathione hydrolase|nr:MBL fold metallo-hydrolase [Candidatus Kapabacteria bacterium]